MWICSRYGFFSVVCASDRTGKNRAVDTSLLMVRARDRVHLELLMERFPKQLGDYKITETAHNDYRFRILVSRPHWVAVARELAEDIDYGNFKSEAKEFQGAEG